MSTIKHVVVVMFENRSYDNVLGWLYHSDNAPPYQSPPVGQSDLNGLTGNESNPVPPPRGGTITVSNQTTPTSSGDTPPYYAPTAIPVIDPGESFSDMAQQFLGLTKLPIFDPYVDVPPSDGLGLTKGYVYNYAQLSGITHPGTPVPEINYKDVMNFLTPAQMPVSAFLAHNYAVCDQWFASAPTQTYTNRVFALCAAPGVRKVPHYSLIEDSQYLGMLDMEDIPSVMLQLDKVLGTPSDPSRPNWKIYFHDYCIALATIPHVAAANVEGNVNLATFDDSDWTTSRPRQLNGDSASTFVEDIQRGYLPAFSLIEPRYLSNLTPMTRWPASSNHPGNASIPGISLGANYPIDAATGEVFLLQLYNLLKSSNLWDDTVLIVTYDEHGGLFDHEKLRAGVSPGGDIPPVFSSTDSAADGFKFDYLGGRVPAMVVSPRIAPGSTVRKDASVKDGSPVFDHTSIIRTVWDAFGLDQGPQGASSLTQRDLAAPSLMPFLQLDPQKDPSPLNQVVVGPGAINFVSTEGSLGLINPQFALASCSPYAPLNVKISVDAPGLSWLMVIIENDSDSMITRITLNASPKRLAVGIHKGTLTILGPDGTRPAVISVTLTIKAKP